MEADLFTVDGVIRSVVRSRKVATKVDPRLEIFDM
ncbi:hypothetical protein GGD56_002699 [Rhizobium mongolense]|uniref:Uncharacterized protein n=1 Tax=Rhizobium mongolense TaxID=57676 RepID=A0ABR6ILV2_9HYPH|nr:hypothetical protein [Rhizobium mongolense]